jgi:hypothetical protein
MFRMLPTMNLEQRVALCWSCLWRQLLFTLPLSALCLGLSLIWGFMHAQWVYPSLVALLEAFCVLGSIGGFNRSTQHPTFLPVFQPGS